MKSAKGAWSPQRAHKEMNQSAKWQLVLRQFNGEFTVIHLWERKHSHIMKPDLMFHNVRDQAGFKNKQLWYFQVDTRVRRTAQVYRMHAFMRALP